MSTEFVTSPKSGVLVSLASNYLLKGHRICFTVDVIKQNSRAGVSLGDATDREILRHEVQMRSRRKNRMSTDAQEIADELEKRINEVEIPAWLPDATAKTKEELKTRLRSLLDHLASAIGRKQGTPESAQ